jgi:hypothetical protein
MVEVALAEILLAVEFVHVETRLVAIQ